MEFKNVLLKSSDKSSSNKDEKLNPNKSTASLFTEDIKEYSHYIMCVVDVLSAEIVRLRIVYSE
jgi:hypothetical protein